MIRFFILPKFSFFCYERQCTNVVISCELRNFMTYFISDLQPLGGKRQGKPPPFLLRAAKTGRK